MRCRMFSLVLLLVCPLLVRSESMNFRRQTALDNKKIVDEASVVKTSLSLLDCARACHTCMAFLYNQDGGRCQMMTSLPSDPQDGVEEQGNMIYAVDKDEETTPSMTYMYLYVNSPHLSWDDARAHCQLLGGDLANVDTPQRAIDIAEYFDSYVGSIANSQWAGLRRTTGGGGDLTWTNGNPMGTALTWSDGYPNEAECGYTSPFENLDFRLFTCTHNLAYLCEIYP